MIDLPVAILIAELFMFFTLFAVSLSINHNTIFLISIAVAIAIAIQVVSFNAGVGYQRSYIINNFELIEK